MRGPVLDREEYIEQEYFFRVYRERLMENVPSQEILKTISEEILATTRLPMAIDFMRAEILHSGKISTAMFRLPHYFAPFQAFVISRAEEDESRFEQLTALKILESEAHFRAVSPSMPGLFIFQFECIARNRLGYGEGLKAMMADPLYSDEWGRWIARLAASLGERELAEIVYGASQHFLNRRNTARSPGEKAAAKTEEGSSPLFLWPCSVIRKGELRKPTLAVTLFTSLRPCRDNSTILRFLVHRRRKPMKTKSCHRFLKLV
jgi:hypothetical protein